MREIKFRAWTGAAMEYNVTVGKFGAFYVNPGAKGDGLDDRDSASLTPFNTIYSATTPVMQFTGLKDEKRTAEYPDGQEIYEGDIVSGNLRNDFGSVQKDVVGKIVQNEPTAGFATELPNGEVFLIGEFVEVIGNIYSNPELLTQDK